MFAKAKSTVNSQGVGLLRGAVEATPHESATPRSWRISVPGEEIFEEVTND